MPGIPAISALLSLTLASTAFAQSWKYDPPSEGGNGASAYTTSNGAYITQSPTALWITYGPEAPTKEGICVFSSCWIKVKINGETAGQSPVTFTFSDGSETAIQSVSPDSTVMSDEARVNWPIAIELTQKLRSNAWVEVLFANGASHRFPLDGSSAAMTQAGTAMQNW